MYRSNATNKRPKARKVAGNLSIALLAILVALAVVGCGSAETAPGGNDAPATPATGATPTATPTLPHTRTPEASATPTTATSPSTTPTPQPGASTGWRSDLPVGSLVGQVSYATPVQLRDGSMATLEEVADDGVLLLYFFATW